MNTSSLSQFLISNYPHTRPHGVVVSEAAAKAYGIEPLLFEEIPDVLPTGITLISDKNPVGAMLPAIRKAGGLASTLDLKDGALELRVIAYDRSVPISSMGNIGFYVIPPLVELGGEPFNQSVFKYNPIRLRSLVEMHHATLFVATEDAVRLLKLVVGDTLADRDVVWCLEKRKEYRLRRSNGIAEATKIFETITLPNTRDDTDYQKAKLLVEFLATEFDQVIYLAPCGENVVSRHFKDRASLVLPSSYNVY
ncbi:MAG: hypothetical protein ACRDBQ_18975 [Shewanella sp.]